MDEDFGGFQESKSGRDDEWGIAVFVLRVGVEVVMRDEEADGVVSFVDDGVVEGVSSFVVGKKRVCA